MFEILILFIVFIVFFLLQLNKEKKEILEKNNLLNLEINRIKGDVIVKSKIITEHEKKISLINIEHEKKISLINIEHEKKIEIINRDHINKIKNNEDYYVNEINSLKENLLYFNGLKEEFDFLKLNESTFSDLKSENIDLKSKIEKFILDNEILNKRLLNLQNKNRENIDDKKYHLEKIESLSNDLSKKYSKIHDLSLELKELKREKKIIEKTKKIEKFKTTELDFYIYEIESIRNEIIEDYKEFIDSLNCKNFSSFDGERFNILSEKILDLLHSNNYIFGSDVSLSDYIKIYKKFSRFHKENLKITKSRNIDYFNNKIYSIIDNFHQDNYDSNIYSMPKEYINSILGLLNKVYVNEDYINLLLSQIMISRKYIYPKKLSLTFGFQEHNPNYIKGIFGEMYCKSFLDNNKISYINFDRFKLDLFGFSYHRVHSNYFDYQHSHKFDVESKTFLKLIKKCSESGTCPYGEIRPCSHNILEFDLNAYLGGVKASCSGKLLQFVDIEDSYTQKEKFILINSKVSMFLKDAQFCSIGFPQLAELCMKSKSIGRIDFFCSDDNDELYCLEVKVNTSRLSLTQEFRLGVLSYFGFKSKIFKVKMKEIDFDDFINFLDTEGIAKTFEYFEMSHQIVDFIPREDVRDYIQKNIGKILEH